METSTIILLDDCPQVSIFRGISKLVIADVVWVCWLQPWGAQPRPDQLQCGDFGRRLGTGPGGPWGVVKPGCGKPWWLKSHPKWWWLGDCLLGLPHVTTVFQCNLCQNHEIITIWLIHWNHIHHQTNGNNYDSNDNVCDDMCVWLDVVLEGYICISEPKDSHLFGLHLQFCGCSEFLNGWWLLETDFLPSNQNWFHKILGKSKHMQTCSSTFFQPNLNPPNPTRSDETLELSPLGLGTVAADEVDEGDMVTRRLGLPCLPHGGLLTYGRRVASKSPKSFKSLDHDLVLKPDCSRNSQHKSSCCESNLPYPIQASHDRTRSMWNWSVRWCANSLAKLVYKVYE